MTKKHKPISDTERRFIGSLTSTPTKYYYMWWLIAFVALTWGGTSVGQALRAMMGKPALSEVAWQAMMATGISSRIVAMMIAFGGLALYGLMLAYARSPAARLDPRTWRLMYYFGFGLIGLTTLYCLWSFAYTIGSV